jgi:D-glucuronyl C5-epimerase C-terminus
MVDRRLFQARVESVVRGSFDIIAGSSWRHDRLATRSTPPYSLDAPWYYDLSRSLNRGDYTTQDPTTRLPAIIRDGQWVHQPVLVLSYGIASLQNAILHGSDREAEALRVAAWAEAEQDSNELHVVPMRFPLPDLPSGWPSSILQGLALSLFARLAWRTDDERWVTQAGRGLTVFDVAVADGGIRSLAPSGVWYEEYPYRKGGSHVLNGFIYALLGLRDLSMLGSAESRRAQELFDEGMASLRAGLRAYDTGFWSLYDSPEWRKGRLTSQYYHRTHTALLDVMATIDPGCPLWLEYRDRFTSYNERLSNRARALSGKLRDTSST